MLESYTERETKELSKVDGERELGGRGSEKGGLGWRSGVGGVRTGEGWE